MVNGYTQVDSPDNLVYLDDPRMTVFWEALTALDTLKIYALKTAPAFEAALYAGLRLAGPVDASIRGCVTTMVPYRVRWSSGKGAGGTRRRHGR